MRGDVIMRFDWNFDPLRGAIVVTTVFSNPFKYRSIFPMVLLPVKDGWAEAEVSFNNGEIVKDSFFCQVKTKQLSQEVQDIAKRTAFSGRLLGFISNENEFFSFFGVEGNNVPKSMKKAVAVLNKYTFKTANLSFFEDAKSSSWEEVIKNMAANEAKEAFFISNNFRTTKGIYEYGYRFMFSANYMTVLKTQYKIK